MNKQTETAVSALQLFTATPANGQKLFLAAARLQANAYQALMRFQIETLGFLKHRFEQDAKLAEDLVASDEFNDAFDIVSNFVDNATSDFAAKVGKVASICSKLASETAKKVRKEAVGAIRDEAAKATVI